MSNISVFPNNDGNEVENHIQSTEVMLNKKHSCIDKNASKEDFNLTDADYVELLNNSSESEPGNVPNSPVPSNDAKLNEFALNKHKILSDFKKSILGSRLLTLKDKEKFNSLLEKFSSPESSNSAVYSLKDEDSIKLLHSELQEFLQNLWNSLKQKRSGLNDSFFKAYLKFQEYDEKVDMKLLDTETAENEKIYSSSKMQLAAEDSWTDDESSSSSSSSDSDFVLEEWERSSTPKVKPMKTKGELDIEDLPPIEDLCISVEEKELNKIGKIHAIVGKLVVVQALKDQKPLDIESILFLSADKPLGRIFEVFGPVVEPFYTVLFNAAEDISLKGINIGLDVFYCPQNSEITTYVFLDALRQQKGSDASWKDNNEPPEEFLDYSDDEQERAAKLKRRGKNRSREEEEDIQIISTSDKQSKSYQKKNFSANSESTPRNFFAFPRNKLPSHSTPAQNSRSLNDVPVWISSPPPFLQTTQPMQPRINSFSSSRFPQPSSPQTFQRASPHPQNFQQASPHLQNFQWPSPHPQNFQRASPHPQNFQHASPVISQSASNYIPPPHPLSHIVQQNMPCNRGHTFGQITPIAAVSPMPVYSSASPVMFIPSNQVLSTNMIAYTPPPALSPRPFFQQREQLTSPVAYVQSPPPNVPLNVQGPVRFPLVNFPAANCFSMPPPVVQSNNLFLNCPPPNFRF